MKIRIGWMTPEMGVELVSPDGETIDIVSYLGALTGAVKMLSQHIQELRGV